MVVESAISFREQLKTAYYLSNQTEKFKASDQFPIYYNGINYLAKINIDTSFLAMSEYCKLFNISKKSDPFLVSAANSYPMAKGNSKYSIYINT